MKNKIILIFASWLISVAVVLFVFDERRTGAFIAKSFFLFIGLQVLIKTSIAAAADIETYRKTKKLAEIVSLPILLAGILFVLFIIVQFIDLEATRP